MSATSCIALGWCCATAMMDVGKCILEFHQGSYLKLALIMATCPPTKLPRFHSNSLFLSFSSLSSFSSKETSAQMGYLELRWSKHWLCLMSKSCE